ncbi:MAG TPA: hypothetical protein VGO39_07890 [Gaiellaceae bacterium]|jgi:hypothetical protein|nr:hypothetical protein [Gaiellaceae bacterium]
MLNRVATERKPEYVDAVLDFVPDLEGDWPDMIEVSAASRSVRVRLRLHPDELEVLAVALDSAFTGGDGELYFRPKLEA